jgi:hypothetical protein
VADPVESRRPRFFITAGTSNPLRLRAEPFHRSRFVIDHALRPKPASATTFMTYTLFLIGSALLGVGLVRRLFGTLLGGAEEAMWGLVSGWMLTTCAAYLVARLAGRPVLHGFITWPWSHGYDFAERDADVKTIYTGASQAVELLRYYGVEYVYFGAAEENAGRAPRLFRRVLSRHLPERARRHLRRARRPRFGRRCAARRRHVNSPLRPSAPRVRRAAR